MPKSESAAQINKGTFITIEGQKFAYKAEHVVKENGWIAFDRINTKTGEVSHMEFPLNKVVGIEVR